MQDVMERCQLLRTSSVFSKCHHRVDPEVFIGLCEEDMCRCAQDMHCHCPTFHEYARSCAQQGVIVDGWPNDSSCSKSISLRFQSFPLRLLLLNPQIYTLQLRGSVRKSFHACPGLSSKIILLACSLLACIYSMGVSSHDMAPLSVECCQPWAVGWGGLISNSANKLPE